MKVDLGPKVEQALLDRATRKFWAIFDERRGRLMAVKKYPITLFSTYRGAMTGVAFPWERPIQVLVRPLVTRRAAKR